MKLDDASAYRALLSRDPRFDGRFFVGVASTGIYCRPVCRVRTPKASSCRYYDSAAAAEAAGFRPCLRCRPELAPGVAQVDSPAALAAAAARLIEAAGGAAPIPQIAARIGITERHLRRIFAEAHGVAPIEYAQTQRLLLAKRLLTDTTLPVLEVALLAGFGSLRRLNALFRSRYRMAPGALRREAAGAAHAAPPDVLEFGLDYRPPYDWDALLAFFRGRAVPGVEQVEADCYRRTLELPVHAPGAAPGLVRGWIEVRHQPDRQRLQLRVASSLRQALAPLLAAVRRQFDLDCDPQQVSAALGVLAAPRPGLRLPGAINGFEQALRAVLGQQVSVAAATTLAGRLAARFGTPLTTPQAGLALLFPTPQRLLAASVDELTALGILAARARTLQGIAAAVVDGRLRLDPHAPVEATLAALRALPGIGEWTAQYIALRCLSWPDAFPHGDLVVRRAFPGLTPKAVLAAAEGWRPWRGYATLHLWKEAST